jgi:hypothetical protein
MLKTILCIVILFLFSACATATKSTLLGAAIGGTVGAFLGSAANISDPQRGTVVGGVVGAGMGGLVGYAAYQGEEKKKARAGSQSPEFKVDEQFVPSYSVPVIKKVRIEDKIEDGKYIMGHDVWILEQPSQWRKTR